MASALSPIFRSAPSRGSTIFVPHGLGHGFGNPSKRRARMLQIDSTGHREEMFEEMSAHSLRARHPTVVASGNSEEVRHPAA